MALYRRKNETVEEYRKRYDIWYEKNKEKINIKRRMDYKNNPENRKKRLAYGQVWKDNNPEKMYEYTKQWRKKNPEKHLEWHRQWRKKNPEKHLQSVMKWKKQNPEKVSQYKNTFNDNNPEYNRIWYKNNPEKVRRKKQKHMDGLRNKIISFLGGKCNECGSTDELVVCYIDNKIYHSEMTSKFGYHRDKMFRYYRDHLEESKTKLQVLCYTDNRQLHRLTQNFPFYDTNIEIIMKNLLNYLDIPFVSQAKFKYPKFSHKSDFFIDPNICIEVDGDYWHTRPGRKERDEHVNSVLGQHGFRVIRFWGSDILYNLDWVEKEIKKHLISKYYFQNTNK